MWAAAAIILKWFTGFLIASVIARITSFVVIAGISHLFMDWIVGEIQNLVGQLPGAWLQITTLFGFWTALGIITGALTLKAAFSRSWAPMGIGG